MAQGTRHWDMPDGFMNRLTQQEGKANPSRWSTLYATAGEYEHSDRVLYISEKTAKFINALYEELKVRIYSIPNLTGVENEEHRTHSFMTLEDWEKLPKERITFFYYVAAMASERMQEALDVRPEHCFRKMFGARVEIQKNYNIKQAKRQHDIDHEYIQRVFLGYLKWHLK
jgi:hypothetical protein